MFVISQLCPMKRDALKRVLPMIKTINSWRGLMAVVVVFFHSGYGQLWNWTYSGVTFFFIASAFLLTRRHPFEELTVEGYKKFAFSHALKIYPLNWLALLLMAALAIGLNAMQVDWGNVALTALLVQSWSPVHDVHYGLNPVAWFLSALIFCYLVYPFLVHWLGRWRLRYKVVLAAVLIVLLGLILLSLDIEGRETVFVNPLAHVVDFVVGLVLIHLYHVLKKRFSTVGFATATLIEILSLALLVVTIIISVKTTWVKPWEDVIIWLLPQGCILLMMALLDGHEGALGKVLLCKPLQWLGNLSFEVYVLQFVAFYIFNYVLSPVAGHFGIMIYEYKAWGVWLVLLPLAWVVNRCFTRPLGACIKRNIQ